MMSDAPAELSSKDVEALARQADQFMSIFSGGTHETRARSELFLSKATIRTCRCGVSAWVTEFPPFWHSHCQPRRFVGATCEGVRG